MLKGQKNPMAGVFDQKDAFAPDKEQIPPHWACYITVHDINATVAKAKGLGGNIIVPPTQVPKVGLFSVIQDPREAVFSPFEYHMEK